MVNFKDVLLNLLIGIFWMLSSILLAGIGYPYLIILTFALTVFLKLKLKDHKRILPYVKEDFKKLGFELISERALKFSELKIEFNPRPAIFVNNIPVSRYAYVRRFSRIFGAITNQKKEIQLNTIVTKKWNGEHIIEIIDMKNVS